MNSVQLLGNLARDPELRYTKTGKAVASFTVAATNSYVDSATGEAKEFTAFVACVAWGKMGEAVGALQKGSRVFVGGRLNTRSYEAKDGSKRYITEVTADFVGESLLTDTGSTAASNFDSFGGGKENVPF
jgi:single-strand DNA-binding protein